MLVGLLCHQPLVVLGNVLGLMERTLFCAPVQNSCSVEEEAFKREEVEGDRRRGRRGRSGGQGRRPRGKGKRGKRRRGGRRKRGVGGGEWEGGERGEEKKKKGGWSEGGKRCHIMAG